MLYMQIFKHFFAFLNNKTANTTLQSSKDKPSEHFFFYILHPNQGVRPLDSLYKYSVSLQKVSFLSLGCSVFCIFAPKIKTNKDLKNKKQMLMKKIYAIMATLGMCCMNVNAQNATSYDDKYIKEWLHSDEWILVSKEHESAKLEYTYDEKGDPIKCTTTYKNAGHEGEIFEEYWEYNDNHQMISYSGGSDYKTYSYNADGKIESTAEYKKSNDNLILNHKTIYTYEGDKSIINSQYYNYLGEFDKEYFLGEEYTYDEKGNVSSFVYSYYKNDGGTLTLTEEEIDEYTYDENGYVLTDKQSYSEGGEREEYCTFFFEYTFTPEGYMASKKRTSTLNRSDFEYTHVYSYTTDGDKLIINSNNEITYTVMKKPSTAVTSIPSPSASGRIYNLQGQEVSRSFRGIQIKNGKKFLMK